MIIPLLRNYTFGNIKVTAKGRGFNRFLNICKKREFIISDIKNLGGGKYYFTTYPKYFFYMTKVAKKTGFKLKIIKKIGLPFVFNKMKYRKFFIIGAVLCILILYSISSLIWIVEITGNKIVTTNEINRQLLTNGITKGVIKYNIDTKDIAEKLMQEFEELSWVFVSVKGTKLKIDMAERVAIPELIPIDVPCDLVAKKDGIIIGTFVKRGERMVVPGTTVKKGDILVSGIIKPKFEDQEIKYTHALGEIKARTWYEKIIKVDNIKQRMVITNNKMTIKSMNIFGKEIFLTKNDIKFKFYDTIETVNKFIINDRFVFPIQYKEYEVLEKTLETDYLTIEEGKKEAIRIAMDSLKDDIPREATKTNTIVNFKEIEDKGLYLFLVIESVENIATKRVIGGLDKN